MSDGAKREIARRALAARSLIDFARYMGAPPSYDAYETLWFHRVIAEALERVERGECRRLLIEIPPRHGKTVLVSVLFPAWYLGRHPDRFVISTGYDQDRANSYSRAVQDAMHRPQYRAVFGAAGGAGGERHKGVEQAKEFTLDRGGKLLAAGVNSRVTGEGAHVLLIDDPTKDREQAESPTYRERTWRWYTDTLLSRRESPETPVVLIQQRWHLEDLAGRLLAHEGDEWEVICLPARAEDHEYRHPADERANGEMLWPAKYDRAAAEDGERRSPRGFASQYQQRPFTQEGGLFRSSWFRYYERFGDDAVQLESGGVRRYSEMQRYLTVDLAARKDAKADYTCACVWGAVYRPEPAVVLLDVLHERLSGAELLPALERLTSRWKAATVWIESTGMQLALVDLARSRGLPVRELHADKSKYARADAATSPLQAGHVYWPRQHRLLHTLETELLAFPDGSHDDIVDAVAYGLRVFMGRAMLGQSKPPSTRSVEKRRERPVIDLTPPPS